MAVLRYISVKTVEANLTRIYRKLGLRGRVDLARHKLDLWPGRRRFCRTLGDVPDCRRHGAGWSHGFDPGIRAR
jgi:Bacterial regulatory proteins, luxR family